MTRPSSHRKRRTRGQAEASHDSKQPSGQQQQPATKKESTENRQPATMTPLKRDSASMLSGGDSSAQPFDALADKLAKPILDGLRRMGFEYMTPVQEKVLTQLDPLSSDCLVQAKTGTGKTCAFLIPAIQRVLENSSNPYWKAQAKILVICPTRELAVQIQKECDGLTACMNPKMECYSLFGGTARASSLSKFLSGRPTIVVATPGRLNDVLGEEAVRDKFSGLQTVVLDEADRMLDQGFAPAIYKILKQIPPKSDGWQGMCFSATLPNQVKDVVKCVLHPGYQSLSTLDPNEIPTADRVPQYFVEYTNVKDIFSALYVVVKTESDEDPKNFKAIVFATTANGTALLFSLFEKLMPQFQVFQLHSRMSQSARTRTTEDFKCAASGILFASDVVGRGMDFPNVGHVFQLGLPSSADQYVHRVGRTARAGREGRAVLVVSGREAFFVKVNKGLPIQPYPVQIENGFTMCAPQISTALNSVDMQTKARAYQAYLGYNKTFMSKLKLKPETLVQEANEFADAMGCPEPPLLTKQVVGKMGLKGVSGLRIGVPKGE